MTDWTWKGPERRAYTRREWVSATAASVLITPLSSEAAAPSGVVRSQQPAGAPLPLTEFQPKSMLHVRESRVQRARYGNGLKMRISMSGWASTSFASARSSSPSMKSSRRTRTRTPRCAAAIMSGE